MEYLIKQGQPQGHYRIVILDTKQAGDFALYPKCDKLKDLPKLVEKNPVCVYAPCSAEVKNPDYHEGFFEWCYNRWNTRIVIDELGSIVYGNDTPDSYKDVTDRGRARKVTVLQGSQKPVFIPHAALSENDHFFVFDLQIESARKKMAGIMGEAVKKRPIDPYGFWYYHHKLLNPEYISGIQL